MIYVVTSSLSKCEAMQDGPLLHVAAAAAKSLQSCPTLCDPIDSSPRGSPIHGILQARTLEWVAISFSNAWTWKVKVKSLSRVRLFVTPWTAAHQAPPSMGFSRQEYWSGVPLPSPILICIIYIIGKKQQCYFHCESESCSVVSDSVIPWTVGILQARILEWVALCFFRGSSQSRDQTQVSHIANRFFTSLATREAQEYWSG